MTGHSARIAALSPAKRELLLQRLKKEQAAVSSSDSNLPQITPNPEQRHSPFPLTDVQRAYWIGQSGLFDLSTCVNVYLEYELSYQLPKEKPALNWRTILGWLGRTIGRKYLEKKIAAFFIEQLNLALQRLIAHHDMLRAIVSPDGQQKILPQVPAYQVGTVNLRGKRRHRVESELAKIRERLRYTKMPSDRWPLFEFLVCLLDDQLILLLVRVDPLIIDGESRGILTNELNQLLLAPQFPLPPVACTYRDYALTWTAFQESELYQSARDYWLACLPTMPPAPELPRTQTVSPLTPSRFKFLYFELEPEAWRRLKTRAARIDLSPSGIALAAFAELLTAWSLEPRFTIGLIGTYHPPMHPQIEDVFGNFNSLALLAVENRSGSFEERARQLWERLLVDLDHRYFSGHQVLQEWNRRQGGSSRASTPIYFNSLIENNQPNHPARRRQQERQIETEQPSFYQLETVEVGAYFPQLLLTCYLWEQSNDALLCKWQIVEAIFPPGMINDMLQTYRRFLKRLAEDESSWRETVPCLTPAEHLTRRDAINASAAPASRAMLHTLFATQVSRRPHQAAVTAHTRSLTYETLHRRANRVGRRLGQLGARPNKLVAVVVESGWEQVVAVLGVLASGAAYLPLDPRLPKECLASLLAHGEVQWVLTQSWLDESLEWPENVLRLCVDDDDEWAAMDDRPIEPVQTPEDLACLIHTSPTSGKPKGVMLTHQGIVNTVLDVNRRWQVGPRDSILALSPLNSDLAIYDIFGPLSAGGTIVVPEASNAPQPARWAELMHRQQVTMWNSPPALLELLLAHVAEHPSLAPRALRLALLSRDKMSVTLPQRLKAWTKKVQAVALWGAAEAAIWSGFYAAENTGLTFQKHSAGQSLANQRLHVLDAALEPRPAWVPGHLYIAGPGLAQGYWKDRDETLARFVQHPRTGERLYRSGELGRFLPDGTLEFLGCEKDFQAVIHGYRVTLRQIEMALEQHPSVAQCHVVVRQDTRNCDRLVACVVPQPGQALTAESLRTLVKESLPEYMVPAVFVTLTSVPLTSTGQVDRAALSRLADDRARPRAERVAPRNALELQLAQIWESLLDRRPIGVTDNFFDLGGNSFLTVCLMNQIQQAFGVQEPLYTFLYQPTIEYLADTLNQRIRNERGQDDATKSK